MVGKETITSLDIAEVTGINNNDVMRWLSNKSASMSNTLKEEEREGSSVSSVGKLVNADQNGSLNIMRKVVGDSYVSRIVNSGHSLCPVRYSNPFVRIV